ncbi:hypothetical protein QL285_040386 [Trifolium repens]|nr:hypothetical protein QL285_040386 [Trifolium repens]
MMEFTEYSDLVAALLVAEQNNELLIKNHQLRPTGTIVYPEINATTFNQGRGDIITLKDVAVILILVVMVEANITVATTFVVEVVDEDK